MDGGQSSGQGTLRGADPQPARPLSVAAGDPDRERANHSAAGNAPHRISPHQSAPLPAARLRPRSRLRRLRRPPARRSSTSGFRSVESEIDRQADLFDARSAPATSPVPGVPDMLTWLAGWIGVDVRPRLAGGAAAASLDDGCPALSLPRHPARACGARCCCFSAWTRSPLSVAPLPARRPALRSHASGSRRRSSWSTGRSAAGSTSAPAASATLRFSGARASWAAASSTTTRSAGVTRLDTSARRDARPVQRRRLRLHRLRARRPRAHRAAESLGAAPAGPGASGLDAGEAALRAAAHAHRHPGQHRLRRVVGCWPEGVLLNDARLGKATVLSAAPNVDRGPRVGRSRIGAGMRIA